MTYRFSDRIAHIKPSAIREILKAPADADTISFAAGNPAAESFPVREMAEIAADLFANHASAALQYGVSDGYLPLRECIAKRQKEVWNIGKSVSAGDKFNDSTIIVSGGTQGIELACKILCNEGESVICENPSFVGALNSFRSTVSARTIGVPLLEDGPDIAELERVLDHTKDAHLLYLIPTFQNPAGLTTSLAKRKAIYEIALRHHVIILEDNPYGELRFSGEEIPTIKSMDTEGIVIYCSSLSKILSAGMRIGFIVAPEDITAKMVVAKQSEDVHSNLFFQMLCHKFMTEYDLDAHIEKIRAIYRRKCGLMLSCLDREVPSWLHYTRPEGGLFIWCTLPASVPMNEFVRACMDVKLRVVPGTTFNCDTEAPSQSFRINYSTPSDSQIEEGCRRLGAVARSFSK
ncbi:MAG: PLP-dependent aminotransferase family protein [Clostridia bacterium]|nr:PLP-dependent aminotransferase family protein [Clostridia bacterium]